MAITAMMSITRPPHSNTGIKGKPCIVIVPAKLPP